MALEISVQDLFCSTVILITYFKLFLTKLEIGTIAHFRDSVLASLVDCGTASWMGIKGRAVAGATSGTREENSERADSYCRSDLITANTRGVLLLINKSILWPPLLALCLKYI